LFKIVENSFFSLTQELKAEAPRLRAGDHMKKFSVWASCDSSLEEIVKLAESEHGAQLPVMEDQRFVGLFNVERYYFLKNRGLLLRDGGLKDLLVSNPILVSPRAPLIEVCREMSNMGHDISVVMERGLPIGFVGWREGVRVLLKLVS